MSTEPTPEQKRACDIVTAAIFGSDEAAAALIEQAAKHQVQPNAGPLTPDQQHNALQLLQALADADGDYYTDAPECSRAVARIQRHMERARKFLAQVKEPTA